jgi:hypothetical protein
VTNSFAAFVMMRQREIAIGTRDDMTAGRTLDGGCKTAPIQQQNNLTIVVKRLLNRLIERLGNRSSIRVASIASQVDRRDLR